MYCNNCGKETGSAKLCQNCGVELNCDAQQETDEVKHETMDSSEKIKNEWEQKKARKKKLGWYAFILLLVLIFIGNIGTSEATEETSTSEATEETSTSEATEETSTTEEEYAYEPYVYGSVIKNENNSTTNNTRYTLPNDIVLSIEYQEVLTGYDGEYEMYDVEYENPVSVIWIEIENNSDTDYLLIPSDLVYTSDTGYQLEESYTTLDSYNYKDNLSMVSIEPGNKVEGYVAIDVTNGEYVETITYDNMGDSFTITLPAPNK